MTGNGYATENCYGEWEGDSYTGEFKEGLRHGLGTYTYSDGDVYVGEYIEGEMHGTGSYYFQNGDVYSGDFENGKKPEMGHTISMMAQFTLGLGKRG